MAQVWLLLAGNASCFGQRFAGLMFLSYSALNLSGKICPLLLLSATSLIFKMWKSNLVIVQVVHFRPDAFFRLMRSQDLPLSLLA